MLPHKQVGSDTFDGVGTGGRWDEVSDGALVEAVGSRDEGALQEIYRRYGSAVWSVVKRVCGAGPRAERVCAGVFTELWARGVDATQSVKASLVARAYVGALAENGVHRDLERDALLLVSVGGCGRSEAARLLGVSEDEVKAGLRRAMSRAGVAR